MELEGDSYPECVRMWNPEDDHDFDCKLKPK